MAEYLSPGVFVEEFDSGAVPMASVGTSTVGFLGVTEKGPHNGAPFLALFVRLVDIYPKMNLESIVI